MRTNNRQQAKISGIILLLVVCLGGVLKAQIVSIGPYVTLPESRLWIEGRSNVTGFSCQSQTLNGYAFFTSTEDASDLAANVHNLGSLYFFIPVESFDCGKKRMNSDMYKALKEESHPMIEYEMQTSTKISSPDSSNGWYHFQTVGELKIAGKTKQIELELKLREHGAKNFRVTGMIPVSMYDFDIKPPSALFGLIKAKPDLTVHFDLVVDAKSAKEQRNTANK